MYRILNLILALIIINGAHAQTSAVNTAANSSRIIIPVVVHVLYNNSVQNISDAQIASQITVLNNDYNGRNADKIRIPSYFAALAGSANIEFRLANVDANNIATSGIVRKYTTREMFGTDDRIKSAAAGGDNAWDRNKYLNIWVGNLAGGIMGYASLPNCDAAKDGVVISYTAFGTTGTATAPFNLGRTATHEIGHWLNLIHIWGDTYCGDDQVDDTPKQRMANKGMPTGERFSCEQNAHGDMYMNFMDLTNDAGMHLFTLGQCARMRAMFERGGARFALLYSPALNGTAMVQAPLPVQTSVKEEAGQPISVYPNPAATTITVETGYKSQSDKCTLTVYNGIGQPLLSLNVSASKMQVNVSSLKAGTYYLRIVTGGGTKTLSFIKR